MTNRLASGRLSRRRLIISGGSLLLIATVVQACGRSSEPPAVAPALPTPAFVHAIAAWKGETTTFAPPGGATQLAWADVVDAYVTDRVAMCSGWGGHGTAAAL